MLKTRCMSTRKTMIITDGTPRYNVATETLQTTEPVSGAGYVAYTIQQSDLPTFSFPQVSVKYDVMLFAWGKNTNASPQTLTYRTSLTPNGESESTVVTTATLSVTANNYWTLQMCYQAVANPVNETVKLYIFDANGIMDIRGSAVLVYPTQLQLENSHFLYDFTWGNVTSPTPLSGVVGINQGGSTDSFNKYDEYSTGTGTAATSKKAVFSDPYCFSHQFTDGSNSNKVVTAINATYYPYYTHVRYPHAISYRPIYTERRI